MTASASNQFTQYMVTWIIKLPILAVVLFVMLSIVANHIHRDYDVHEFELEIIKDRLAYCLDHHLFTTMEKDCLPEERYSGKITHGEEEVIINQKLYQQKPLCDTDSSIYCSGAYTTARQGKTYTIELVMDGGRNA